MMDGLRAACGVCLLAVAAMTAGQFDTVAAYLAQVGGGDIAPRLALAVLVCCAASLGCAAAWLRAGGTSGLTLSVAIAITSAAWAALGAVAYVRSFSCGCTSIPPGWGPAGLATIGLGGVLIAGVVYRRSRAGGVRNEMAGS